MTFTFTVRGTPAPKGSFRISSRRGTKRGFVVRKDSDATEVWEQVVALTARLAMRGLTMFTGAVEVEMVFRLDRPPSVKRKWPSVKPDGDKLERSTLDALVKAGVLKDDALAVDLIARKRYATGGEDEGVTITVKEMP
jgi:Holliday junction resolvase RusA-like endonuclease